MDGQENVLNSNPRIAGENGGQKKVSRPRIIAFGGGKGGVGKSVIATMLAMTLSSIGKSTILIDADLSGANLLSFLGAEQHQGDFSNYLRTPGISLQQLVKKSPFKNLSYIAAKINLDSSGQLKYYEKQKFLRELRHLESEYVLLDVGSGTSLTGIDLFNGADQSIVVTTCDAFSIYDVFGFIRTALMRKLQRAFFHLPEFLNLLEDCGNLTEGYRVKSIDAVIKALKTVPQNAGQVLDKELTEFVPKIIVNNVYENETMLEVKALRLALRDLLNIQTDVWGIVRHDSAVRAAVRTLRPDLLLTANGRASEDILRIVNRNIVASELGVKDLDLKEWTRPPRVSADYDPFRFVRICNYRCIAWECCPEREGGMPCSLLNPASLKKAANSI